MALETLYLARSTTWLAFASPLILVTEDLRVSESRGFGVPLLGYVQAAHSYRPGSRKEGPRE